VLSLSLVLLCFLFSSDLKDPRASVSSLGVQPGVERHVREEFGRLPLSFEANYGQADQPARFLARRSGSVCFLSPGEITVQFSYRAARAAQTAPRDLVPTQSGSQATASDVTKLSAGGVGETATLRMELLGSNRNAAMEGLDPLPGKSNYFIGKDPAGWHRNIPTFSKVRYRNIYPGIDLSVYGNQQHLEYDFVLAAGADPEAIRLAARSRAGKESSQSEVQLDAQGDLLIGPAAKAVRQRAPRAYQLIEGKRVPVICSYLLLGQGKVAFRVGAYDRLRELIIDPVIESSTYLGGSGSDTGIDVAVDGPGNIYVCGNTSSLNFPTAQPKQATYGGGSSDVFVAKLNPTGDTLLYSTYLGGNDAELISVTAGVAVDSSGSAYIAGQTTSANFPTTAGSFRPTPAGASDAFVAKLSPQGDSLAYATYLGGAANDNGWGLAVDGSGNAYVTGVTISTNFPTLNAVQSSIKRDSSNNVTQDAFVTKLNAAGSGLVFSTYLGGNRSDYGLGITVDALSNVYLVGNSTSTDLATSGSAQSVYGGGTTFGDAFVAKLNATGSGIVYLTYLGGTQDEEGRAVAVDDQGNMYAAGYTRSSNYPSLNPVQSNFGGGTCAGAPCPDAFVTKLSAGGAFVYSTFIGGNGDDRAQGLAVDASGNAHVSGFTNSTNFRAIGSSQIGLAGGYDIFISKLNSTGQAYIYSALLGGSGDDQAFGLALDAAGSVFVTGQTGSADFPTLNAYQGSRAGSTDGFVAKLSDCAQLFVPIVVSAAGLNGSMFTTELTLTNRFSRNATLQVTYTAAFGEGSGTFMDRVTGSHQRIIANVVSYMRQNGLAIPTSGNQGGTLSICSSGTGTALDVAATARTTTTVLNGRAGLAYGAVRPNQAFSGPSYLAGLRQNAADRSNVALQNLGTASQGPITLRLTVYSGDSAAFQVLPDIVLDPAGFAQVNGILQAEGLSYTSGYVRVEKISGTAPYNAYAVINDQANSDGSFVPAVAETALVGKTGLTLPVIVEASPFSSELVLTNWSNASKTLRCAFVADAVQAAASTATFEVPLAPGQQTVLPEIVQWLRTSNVAGIGPKGPVFAGSVFVTTDSGDLSGIFVGARTSAPGSRGQFGVFYTGVPYGSASTTSAWLYGLQQNQQSRTNLALVNTGEVDNSPSVFRVEVYDGDTGAKVATIDDLTVESRQWRQYGAFLTTYAPGSRNGFARVTRVSGANPFIAYLIVNDGANPGERTGDGAFIPSSP